MNELNELKVRINEKLAELEKNLNAESKAAAARARKDSLELEKMFKEYRKLSIAAEKVKA